MKTIFAHKTEWTDHNNYYHRVNEPAIIWNSGYKEYWFHGNRHRTDGPAVIYKDGDTEYWIMGSRHRIDGPAIEYKDGFRAYFIHGMPLTKKEFEMYDFVNTL